MKQIVVHCEQGLTKAALLEDGQLTEFYMERPASKQLVGSIYKGTVVNVLPGMQAAFVDIGLEKNAFLFIDDLLPAHLDKQPAIKPSIAELVEEKQTLLVQIVKEPIGTKGARVTTHFSIPGRWLVYMPEADYVAVSRKIESEAEKKRLKQLADELRAPGEGLILRTVAEGESREALEHDLHVLRKRWDNIKKKAETRNAPAEIYRDLDMMPRLVRDIFTDDVDEIIIDERSKGDEIMREVREVSPKLAERVKIYDARAPLFEKYGIEEQLDKAFRPKIWLDSGGHVIIDQTEALTVIDVNTGKFTGSVDLEQTVFETNMEAAEKIARLLRLRDIGGIIIVDFIDMEREEHRHTIVKRLEELLKQDRTKALVIGWTKLGLLEITRKKVKENMDSLFFEPCPYCGGKGKAYFRKGCHKY